MNDKLNFQYFNEALLNMGSISSAAELQGLLCGKLCGSGSADEEMPHEWMMDTQRFMDMEYLQLDSDQAALVVELYGMSLRELDDSDFIFRPLLPDDSSSLKRRAEELAAWCRGYLHGIGTSGLQGSHEFSSDVADAIKDLAKISQVELEIDGADTEKLEADWEGLVEYVKVVVLNLREELRSGKKANEPSPSVH